MPKKKNPSAMAGERSHIYGFLTMVYRREVTPDFLKQIKDPRFLGVLSDLGARFDDDLIGKPEQDLIEELAVEYARLFLGPGRHISPHESVHHEMDGGKWGQLWGDATVAVKKFIEASGLHYQDGYKGLPDHISVELEFMQQLTLREARAWEAGDKEGADFCRNIEKKFIAEHLAPWIPAFCGKVAKEAELPFYKHMAEITRNFIEFEKQEMDQEAAGDSN